MQHWYDSSVSQFQKNDITLLGVCCNTDFHLFADMQNSKMDHVVDAGHVIPQDFQTDEDDHDGRFRWFHQFPKEVASLRQPSGRNRRSPKPSAHDARVLPKQKQRLLRLRILLLRHNGCWCHSSISSSLPCFLVGKKTVLRAGAVTGQSIVNS